MTKAYPLATTLQLYIYGRNLLRQKKAREAFDVFKKAYAKDPNDIYTLIGMIKGNAATGNMKEAVKFGDKALAISKDTNTKSYIEKMVADVKAGNDISNM